MIRSLSIVLMIGVTLPLVADDSGKRVYSEAFKKGATRIQEQTLEVSLAPEKATQDFKVLDANGKARYTLRFLPDIPRGDTKVLGWFVRLVDLHHKIYDSVLPTSPDLSRDTQQVWWLDGRPYSKIPLQTARVFKVEQFYCVVRVKEIKRLDPSRPYLSQLDLNVQFTNIKP